MKRPVFRQSAVERLSSPEQLDQLMQVTSSKGWLALLALCALIAAAVLWSVLGSIPTRVTSQGILIKSGGLLDIVALGSGQLIEIGVGVGDDVRKGQIVARIAQPELEEQIAKAEEKLIELDAQHQRLVEHGSEDVRLKSIVMAQQRQNLERSIEVARERQRWHEEKLRTQEGLTERGLVTRATLLETSQQLEAAKQEIERSNADLKQLTVDAQQLRAQKEREVEASQAEINDARRALLLVRQKLELASTVVSTDAGRVVEVRADPGNVVSPGTPIVNLELVGDQSQDLEAILYVPPAEGKSIRPGMTVQIAPSTVRSEEYGHMLAVVRSVAEYPASREGMMRVLENEELVTNFMRDSGGAPIPVHAELIPDEHTVSSYRWSSSKGPPTRIYSGTLCSGKVTVREQRPISLVLPIFRQYLGV